MEGTRERCGGKEMESNKQTCRAVFSMFHHLHEHTTKMTIFHSDFMHFDSKNIISINGSLHDKHMNNQFHKPIATMAPKSRQVLLRCVDDRNLHCNFWLLSGNYTHFNQGP